MPVKGNGGDGGEPAAVAEHLGGEFDVIIDCVGGATFGLAIDALLSRRIGGKAVLHID
jgi:NADPH:quinone reductase-like Zn-dependent oxidoreductase